jgi:hypothetical protein
MEHHLFPKFLALSITCYMVDQNSGAALFPNICRLALPSSLYILESLRCPGAAAVRLHTVVFVEFLSVLEKRAERWSRTSSLPSLPL